MRRLASKELRMSQKHYKTWFEAREECSKLGAKLASVHDQATQEKLLELIAGNETVTSSVEATWIGLQVGARHQVTIEDPDGVRVVIETGCYWPADVCPRLMEDDPDPKNTVDKCSITYNETFRGQWEDGKRYNKAESAAFWGPDEPSDLYKRHCQGVIFRVDEQSQAYCERGPDGKPDKRRHCAQIFPADEKKIGNDDLKLSAGKWTDYWCWMKTRGYICERPAKRSDESEDTTAATFTAGGVERQTSAMPMSCKNRPDNCTKRVRRELKATRTGFDEVINTMVLGGAAPGAPWLGSASFANLAQSAVDFGRSLAKLSAEDCVPESSGLRPQLENVSQKLEESYEKLTADLTANDANLRPATIGTQYIMEIRFAVQLTYADAAKLLRPRDDPGKRYYRESLVNYCEKNFRPPENMTMKMTPYFLPSALHKACEDFNLDLLSYLVEHDPDRIRKVQLLLADVDTMARLALTLLGVCAESMDVPRRSQDDSSKQAIQALSKVNDAFKRALQNDTPPCTSATSTTTTTTTTTPYVEDVVAVINLTAQEVLSKVKDTPELQGWAGREELHEKIVNDTVDALRKNMSDKSNEDLCSRLRTELMKHGVNMTAFGGGVAAMKCSYEFVWYKLGYTYFYAAYSSTNYKWQRKGGAYDAKCGQIFFFP